MEACMEAVYGQQLALHECHMKRLLEMKRQLEEMLELRLNAEHQLELDLRRRAQIVLESNPGEMERVQRRNQEHRRLMERLQDVREERKRRLQQHRAGASGDEQQWQQQHEVNRRLERNDREHMEIMGRLGDLHEHTLESERQHREQLARAIQRSDVHRQIEARKLVLQQELREMATQLMLRAQEVKMVRVKAEQRLRALLEQGPQLAHELERLNAVQKKIDQMYSTRRHAVRKLKEDLGMDGLDAVGPQARRAYPNIQPRDEGDETELPELPDDVLLHIFSFLTPRELLRSVRRVSRRWRRLSGSRDAWRRAEVAVRTSQDVPMVTAVLRTAPVLRRLNMPLNNVSRELALLLAGRDGCSNNSYRSRPTIGTRGSGAAGSSSAADANGDVPSACTVGAIGTLSLSVRTFTHCVWTYRILQRFREGGVRSLRLEGSLVAFGKDIVKVLLGMDKLEKLDVDLWSIQPLDFGEDEDEEQKPDPTGAEAPAAPPTRLLRRLIIRSSTDPIIRKKLIQRFAPGLEQVHILGGSTRTEGPHDGSETALLPAAKGLKRVTLPAIGAFRSVIECRSVTELTLIVNPIPAHFDPSGLLSFLRDATWLKSLCIMNAYLHNHKTLSDMLEAVSSSGRSELETLCLQWSRDTAPWVEAPWVALLPGLPHLVRLHLNYMPSEKVIEDLIAVPGSVPRGLRVLDTGPHRCCVPFRGPGDGSPSAGCRMSALDRLACAQPNPLAVHGLCAPLGVEDPAQQAQCACRRVVDEIFPEDYVDPSKRS